MDPEDQATPLLAPSADLLASVKVFPLITALKKDATVRIHPGLSLMQLTFILCRRLSVCYSLGNLYASNETSQTVLSAGS